MIKIIYYYLKYQNLLKKSDKKIRVYQYNKINSMINYAYKNFECYRKLYDENGVHPSDFKKLNDIKKFPIINKKILKTEVKKVKKVKNNFLWLKSSGSTGAPFSIPIDRDALAMRRATILISYGDIGLKLLKRKGKFWRDVREGKIINKIKERVLRTYWFSVYDTVKKNNTLTDNSYRQIFDLINNKKIKQIDGYPSAIYEFCKFLNKKNYAVKMDLITTGGERLSDNVRKYIEQKLDSKIFDRYGGTELSLIAHQTKDSNNKYKIYKNRLHCWTNKSNLIVTDFTNTAIPLINYDIGDQVIMTRDLNHIKKIYGRIIENFEIGNGEIINGHFFQKIFRDFEEIENYQVIQIKNREFNVKIVSDKKIPKLKPNLESQFKGIKFNILYFDKIKNKNKHIHLIKLK